MIEPSDDGLKVGKYVGSPDTRDVGVEEGSAVGTAVRINEGSDVVKDVGTADICSGDVVGDDETDEVGGHEGMDDGTEDGSLVIKDDGSSVGDMVTG